MTMAPATDSHTSQILALVGTLNTEIDALDGTAGELTAVARNITETINPITERANKFGAPAPAKSALDEGQVTASLIADTVAAISEQSLEVRSTNAAAATGMTPAVHAEDAATSTGGSGNIYATARD